VSLRGKLRLSPYKWKKRVAEIMERDGHKCRMCGTSQGLADVHHIIKRSQGGSDDADNLILLCRDCHNKFHPGPQWTKKEPIRAS
jgi:5-methylcytosine-specific restriction endonuclease McrA